MAGEVVYALERFRDGEPLGSLLRPPGDRARFEQMLNRHHRQLRRMVGGVIANADRVDDVLQESYLKAYRRLPRHFANEAHEAAWLYRVVYRCCLDELRRRRRGREISFPEAQLHAVSADESLGRIALVDAFRKLTPPDRAVLTLVGVIGLDYEAAARILRVPRGTLAWRLSHARRRFREALADEGVTGV